MRHTTEYRSNAGDRYAADILGNFWQWQLQWKRDRRGEEGGGPGEGGLASVKGSSKQGSMGVRTTACNGGSVYEFEIPANATRPAIARLVEHLTVDHCSNQMVPGSIPGGRTFPEASATHCDAHTLSMRLPGIGGEAQRRRRRQRLLVPM